MHIFEEVLFFKLRTTIKTEEQTINWLSSSHLDAGRLAEGKPRCGAELLHAFSLTIWTEVSPIQTGRFTHGYHGTRQFVYNSRSWVRKLVNSAVYCARITWAQQLSLYHGNCVPLTLVRGYPRQSKEGTYHHVMVVINNVVIVIDDVVTIINHVATCYWRYI